MRPEWEPFLIAAALAVTTLGLLRYYRSPDTSLGITVLIFVSWLLGFSGVFLLPFDIADVQTYGRSAPWILQAWQLIYWSTFALTWLVLPVTYSYLESGFFTPRARFLDALRAQLRTACIAVAALLAFVVYLVAQRYTLAGVEGLLMALSNTYGLLFVVVLLGNGSVEIPRRLWNSSFPEKELQRLYFRSSLVDSDLHDAVCNLSDVEAEVAAVREQLRQQPPADPDQAVRMEACLKALLDTRSSFTHRPEDMTMALLIPRTPFGVQSQYDQGSPPPTVAKLAALHARLKTAQLRVQVLKLQRDAVVHQVERTEAVAQGTLRFPDEVKAGDEAGALGRMGAQLAYVGAVLRYHWHTALAHCALRLAACLCALLSLCFLWSEVVLGSPLALSPFGALQQAFGTASPLATQLSVIVPLAYVSLCAYRSLFKFKLFGEFSLQGPRQSLARPLLVNASYLIRLQFPLAYNFLLLLRSPSSKETAFRHLMSNMTVVPVLGRGFVVYSPLVMVVLACFTFFHGYARLLRLLGAYHEDLIEGGEEQEEMIQQGRSLARRRRYPLPSSSGGASAFATSVPPSSSAGGGGAGVGKLLRGQQELGSPTIGRSGQTAYTQLKS